MSEKTTSNDQQARHAPPKKAPYESPAWEVEQTETEAAMGCAKENDATCQPGPIQS